MDHSPSKGTADRVKHILKAMENSIDAVRRKRLGVTAPAPGMQSSGTAGGYSHGVSGISGGIGSGVASGYHAQGHSYSQPRPGIQAGSQGIAGNSARTGQPNTYGSSAMAQGQASSAMHTTTGRTGHANEAMIGRSASPEGPQGAYPFARANGTVGTNVNAAQPPVNGNTPGQPVNGTTPAPGMRLKARPKRLDPSMVKDFPPGTYRSQAG